MPLKTIETPYPLVDADPHFSRVVRYFRFTDYVAWAGATLAFPAAIWAWDKGDPLMKSHVDATKLKQSIEAKGKLPPLTRTRIPLPPVSLKLGGFLGFLGGFLLAYQRSSFRFWGWTENKAEEARDLAELTARAKAGLTLYGESDQPEWVQGAAYRNSAYSQLKFQAFPMFNFVNHPHHGTDPAKYGVKPKAEGEPEAGSS